MSDIERHLRWLRDMGGRTNLEAATAIEALVKDRDAWEAAARNHMEWRENNRERAYIAESEVERLREVLKNIAHFEPDRNSWSVKQARSALEAKP